jgi:hypothetical protein
MDVSGGDGTSSAHFGEKPDARRFASGHSHRAGPLWAGRGLPAAGSQWQQVHFVAPNGFGGMAMGNQPPGNSHGPGESGDSFSREFKRWKRELDKLNRRISHDAEIVENLKAQVDNLPRTIKGGGGGSGSGEGPGDWGRDDAPCIRFSLRIEPSDTRWTKVFIDHNPQFELSELLAMLLSVLAKQPGDGSMPDFKPVDELALALEKLAGRAFRHHAITELIHRLRCELERWYPKGSEVVETQRRRGTRLRILKTATVIANFHRAPS